MKLNKCPGCLTEGFESYCPKCIKTLFDNTKVSHNLNFTRPEFNKTKLEPGNRISISGIQIKHSLKLVMNELVLTEKNGQYILKPIPSGQFEYLDQLPANEHLTMQIASRVFNINTALNGIIFFADGEPAYITKRFDRVSDNTRLLQEDFAQIAGKTEETDGKNYKYDFSYEEIAELIRKNVKAYKIEMEKYFRVILFNYLFSNGDAHLKNFSLYRNEEYGDYLLTPFYDLLNTIIHVPVETDTALDLFKDGYLTESYKSGTKYTRVDFEEFALKIGISENRSQKIIEELLNKSDKVRDLISLSFLNEEIKNKYQQTYLEKLKRLQTRN